MRTVDVIQKKRDRGALSAEEIRFFVQGVKSGLVPDYQASALLMAIFLNGMSPDETLLLTQEMLHSGQVMDWSDLPGLKVDKHSTGGVGDKTSLILAPIVAAAGVYVPMISGRGLRHTGGTLDKLQSIPGFKVHLSAAEFRAVLSATHLALGGQTEEIAPVDRTLYSLRDVTATVESIPLITASILSKKLAEGIDGLVLDVKFGNGAFMKRFEDGERLAESLVRVGTLAGKQVVALMTEMSQPLGSHVGNSLEVVEAVEVLRGKVESDLGLLSLELAAHMLLLGRAEPDLARARVRARRLLESGAAYRKFEEITEAQGGDPRALSDLGRLPKAERTETYRADRDGVVQRVLAQEVGIAAMALGAGRTTVDAVIDPGVGLILRAKVGDPVRQGDALVSLYYNDDRGLGEALGRLAVAYAIGEESPPRTALIQKVIGAKPN